MLPSSFMARWLVFFILCVASLAVARPNNGAEAARVLDDFLSGRMTLNQAINRVQFLGEERYVSGELVMGLRRGGGKLRGQMLEFLVALWVRDPEIERVFLGALSSDDVGEVMNGARGLG